MNIRNPGTGPVQLAQKLIFLEAGISGKLGEILFFKRPNRFAPLKDATLFEIFSTKPLKILKIYCKKLFFILIYFKLLFRFSFGFVLIVFLKFNLRIAYV